MVTSPSRGFTEMHTPYSVESMPIASSAAARKLDVFVHVHRYEGHIVLCVCLYKVAIKNGKLHVSWETLMLPYSPFRNLKVVFCSIIMIYEF